MQELVPTSAVTTTADFDRRYGWEPVGAGQTLDWLWTAELPIEAARLWPHLSDTSLFNRALGLPPVEYQEEGGVRVGRTRYFGVLHEWVEEPWTWVGGRWAECVRRFRRGWLVALRIRAVLEPLADDRTRVIWRMTLLPRGPLTGLGLKLAWSTWVRRYGPLHDDLVARLNAHEAPLRRPAPPLGELVRQRLTRIGAALEEEGVSPEVGRRLLALIAEGDFVDVERLRPLALARDWGLPEREVIRGCLHATRQGALTLSWDVVCPLCRGVRQSVGTLGEMPQEGRCEPCQTTFRMDVSHAVEVTFHIHPSIRLVEQRSYCAAEPAHKEHVKLQLHLEPGQEQLRPTALSPGRYRLRRLGQPLAEALELSVEEGAEEAPWGWSVASPTPQPPRLPPCPTLHLLNDTDTATTVVIESLAWARDSLLPGVLFNLQDFRELFVDEALAAGLQLAVGEQTLLFTDIVGSTGLYAQLGDAEAFAAVRAHFIEVYEEVRQHEGAVVKTIGDAAMASFSRPRDAVAAAVGILRRFEPGRADTPIRLRISIFTGPCIAVNLNSGIDYFGSTVNVAAKLQAIVGDAQLVFPAAALDAGEVEPGPWATERLVFEVPKMGRAIEVVRWTVIES